MNYTSQTITIAGIDYPVISMPVAPQWKTAAEKKGFEIIARVIARYHLALRCLVCGEMNLVRHFTLMKCQPRCQICQHRDWAARVAAAGFTYVKRSAHHDRHYVEVRLACGHAVDRQMALIDRIAAGEIGTRCEVCHAGHERDEAAARGWRLIGPDLKGNSNYRLYAHDGPNGCGHCQRVARANMQTGRFGCAECGVAWSAAPSALYLLAIDLPPESGDGSPERVLKLGMSRDPVSRMRYQLARHKDLRIEILATAPIPRGHDAVLMEKKIHRRLKRWLPYLCVPEKRFSKHLRVKSEIYDLRLEGTLCAIFSLFREK